MPTKVILTFVDQSGRERRVPARLGRLTIGREAGNDLFIDDSNLSRRHAVIENVRGSMQISDCNSRNGTMVNGHPILGVVELFEGDVINLGGSCSITLALRPAATPARAPRFSVPAVAGAVVASILALAGVFLAISVWGNPWKSAATGKPINNQGAKPDHESSPSPSTTAKVGLTPQDRAPDTPEQAKDQIARAIKRVMSKVSNDNAPYISELGINDVERKVAAYRASAELREKLRALKRGCPEITAQAQGLSLKAPLVMYAALAESERSGGGDPVAEARRMMPRLLTLRATFGTETANSSLLLVAAYPYPFNPPIGSQTRTPHPLASKLVEFGGRKSTVDTSEARSVWFLREKNGITPEAYDLVIRLLAIGIIAQNPRQFDIDADPLLC